MVLFENHEGLLRNVRTFRSVHSFEMTIIRPTLGKPAPDFEFVDATGTNRKLREFQGRAVVLIFHRHVN